MGIYSNKNKKHFILTFNFHSSLFHIYLYSAFSVGVSVYQRLPQLTANFHGLSFVMTSYIPLEHVFYFFFISPDEPSGNDELPSGSFSLTFLWRILIHQCMQYFLSLPSELVLYAYWVQ